MKKKILSLCLALMLILSANMILLISAAPAGRVYVDPSSIEFSTDPTQPNYRAVGDNFTVNITAADFVDPGVYAYQFKLYYDNTILNATAVELPPGHFLTPAPGEEPIFVTELKIYQAEGYVSAALTSMGDVLKKKIGSGTLVTITFKITKAPPAAGKLSCKLELRDVIFADPEIIPIEVTLEHGYYEYAAPMPPLPYLKIVPGFAAAKEIGEAVVINVTVQELVDVWKAVGFQWKLVFDTSILQVLDIAEGDFLKNIAAAAGPDYGTYFYAIQEGDYVISFSLYYKYPWPPEVFPAGSGTLATITFNATSVGSCDLTLTDVLIVDVNANQIETRPHQSGKYAFAPPWLSIAPKEYTASSKDVLFDVTVFVNDVSAAWRMVGAEFKIRYNMTLLDLVNITEGGFMKHFATESGTDTWFQYYVEVDPVSKYGIVGIMILPRENGTWPGPFPDTTDYGAPGDLAIVKFKAIYQHPDLDVTGAIWLNGIMLANTEAMQIPYNTEKTEIEGKCKYTITRAVVVIPGPYIDLHTQYPDPWGGQGVHSASDAFPPQGRVRLISDVMYWGDPVPHKPVAYYIRSETTEYFGSNVTGLDGKAVYEFLLPSGVSGLWNATATVDIGGIMVSDWMIFRADWLVTVKSMTIKYNEKVWEVSEGEDASDKITIYKNSTFELSITMSVMTMMDPKICLGMSLKDYEKVDSLLKVTVTDELGQPIALALASLEFGNLTELEHDSQGRFNFVSNGLPRSPIIYPAKSPTNSILIPYFAYSGKATIHANVLTNLPGVPYCPEGKVYIWIKKK